MWRVWNVYTVLLYQDTWHVNTWFWCCDSHQHISYLTLTCIHLILDLLLLDTCYLTLDIRYRYLPCYTWHVISDTDTGHVILNTWYRTLALDMLYLTPDPWHLILTPVLDMLYLTLDPGSWYMTHANTHLTRFHIVVVHLTWYCDTWLVIVIPGTCIILHIHDYHFYGELAWLLYCYQTSDTPVLL